MTKRDISHVVGSSAARPNTRRVVESGSVFRPGLPKEMRCTSEEGKWVPPKHARGASASPRPPGAREKLCGSFRGVPAGGGNKLQPGDSTQKNWLGERSQIFGGNHRVSSHAPVPATDWAESPPYK